jgi:hypothetical protein
MVQIVNGTVLELYTIAKEEYGKGVDYVSAMTEWCIMTVVHI